MEVQVQETFSHVISIMAISWVCGLSIGLIFHWIKKLLLQSWGGTF